MIHSENKWFIILDRKLLSFVFLYTLKCNSSNAKRFNLVTLHLNNNLLYSNLFSSVSSLPFRLFCLLNWTKGIALLKILLVSICDYKLILKDNRKCHAINCTCAIYTTLTLDKVHNQSINLIMSWLYTFVQRSNVDTGNIKHHSHHSKPV